MPVLVLPIADEVELLLLQGGSYAFDPAAVPEIAAALSQTVLFLRGDGLGNRVVGWGRLAALKARPGGEAIAEIREFVSVEGGVIVPFDAAGLRWISRAEAAAILRTARRSVRPVLAERAQAGYVAETGGALADLSRAVKRAYDYRCAVSHHRFGPASTDLMAVAIRPLADGGAAVITNMLPLALPFVPYFDEGAIAVDDDYRLLIDHARVPEGVQRALHPSGRLLLPDNPADWPDRAALVHHRRELFRGP